METAIATLPTIPPANGSNQAHALAIVQEHTDLLPMPVQVAQIVARVDAVKEIVSKVFKGGNHFGEIPGTAKNKDGTAKMVLLKPGFDTLCMAFQFSPEFIKQPETVETDKFINIVYKCRIIHSPTGRIIATGDGSCNSKEEKYRWTTSARKCPTCQGEFIRTSKPTDTQGFYCWKKLGGCGATFAKGCPEIENQPEGRKENDNPWNFHNTLTKMAQKRAGMAAIITACGLSSDFTQDMEDFTENDRRQDTETQRVDIQANDYESRPSAEETQQPAPPPINEFGGEAPTLKPEDPDLARAQDDVRKEVLHCSTKADFLKLKDLMIRRGGLYTDKRVTDILNNAYAYTFPKTQAQGA